MHNDGAIVAFFSFITRAPSAAYTESGHPDCFHGSNEDGWRATGVAEVLHITVYSCEWHTPLPV
jgi:hypothetical protein